MWSRGEGRRLVLVTAAALLLFGYGLSAGTLWDQDEARYFQITRDLAAGSDPFDLRLDGQPWFVHPPLFFWLQALAARALGYTEVAARIWSAVSGAAVVAATFLLARLFYAGTAALAAAVAATTLHLLAQARLGVFDPTLVAFMLLAVYEFLVAYTRGARRAYLWAALWAGVATSTKGPIGLLLPAMLAVALWVVRRDWSAWRRIPLACLPLYTAVGLPWYVIQTVRHGWPFLQTSVGYYMFTRFLGVVENQPGAWYYYVPVLLIGFFPWTGSVAPAVAWLWHRRGELASQVILLWTGITVAFYTVAGTKLPNYVLPVYPVMAIGIAGLWHALLDPSAPGNRETARLWRWMLALQPLPAVLFLAALVVYGGVKFPSEALALRPILTVIAAVFAAGPLAAWVLALAGKRRAALAATLLVLPLAVPVLVHQTLPAIELFRPLARIGRALRSDLTPGDAVILVRLRTAASLRFYLDWPVAWADTREEVEPALCGHQRTFAVVPAGPDDAWLRSYLPARARVHRQDLWVGVYRIDGPVPCARARLPAR